MKNNPKKKELATIPLPGFDAQTDEEKLKFIEALASGHFLENKELIDSVLDRLLDGIEAEWRLKGKKSKGGQSEKEMPPARQKPYRRG